MLELITTILIPLRLKAAPRRGDLSTLAGIWSEALAGYSEEEIRAAILAHVRVSAFFPQLSELEKHLQARRSAISPARAVLPPTDRAIPCAPDLIDPCNQALEALGIDRVVRFAGEGSYCGESPSGAAIVAALRPLDPARLHYWSAVLTAAKTQTHRAMIAISIPLRCHAGALSDDLIEAIAAHYQTKIAIYSE